MRQARRVGGSILLVVVLTDIAAAHDVGATRFDSPIPLALLFLGAGATVALTAGWLGRTEATVPTDSWTVSKFPADTVRSVRAVSRTVFTATVAVAVLQGIVGRQVAAENIATVFVWPLWLKGIGLIAIFVGSPWRLLSPWRGVHWLLSQVEGRELGRFDYPPKWGVWPAVVGFVTVVGVVENLTVIPRSPRFTAGLVALYSAVMVLGGAAFGRTWFRRADFLEVLYRQFGRVAPIRGRVRINGYAVELQFPWKECMNPTRDVGGVAFVVAMVYTVSFDGFTNTPEYQRLLFAVRDALGTGPLTDVGLYFLGLVGFVLSFVGAAALTERIGRSEASVGTTARAFVPTILPIAAAYELAHNYPFVVRNLGQAIGMGFSAGGVDGATVTLLDWLSLPIFWGSQVVFIVLGHVVAVVAAHGVAVDRYETLARARRAHLPLVVVMVGYTVLSLWIISRPVVTG